MSQRRPNWTLVIKSISYLLLFGFFHFIYQLAPSAFSQVIGGTNESIFQHMKMAVFSYSLVSIGEYFINRKWNPGLSKFFHSRALATVLLPWVIFITWYIVPAIMNREMPNLAIELTYSIIITYLSGVIAVIQERNFEMLDFSRWMRIINFILYFGLIFLLIIFSFEKAVGSFF